MFTHRLRLLTSALWIAAVVPIAGVAAVCSQIPDSAKYYGRLVDGRTFGVTLVASDTTFAAVHGRLYVAPGYEDIAVEGEVVGANELQLREAATGRPVLQGRFLDRFEGLADLGCDALAVVLDDSARGAMSMRAFRFGALPDRKAINEAMLDVHDAAMAGDLRRFARHVRYPLVVTFIDRKPYRRVVIRDAAQFVRMGPKLVGPNLRRFLAADVPHDPFCRGDDCMLAGGFVWFGPDRKIDALVPG